MIEAESAFKALDMLKVERPDAVVSDVFMPGMNGLIFYQHLIERVPSTAQSGGLPDGCQSRSRRSTVRSSNWSVPLLRKLDDLRLLVDAVRLALLRPLEPEEK